MARFTCIYQVISGNDKLSEDNLLNFAEEFLKASTFSDNDTMTIQTKQPWDNTKTKPARDETPFSYSEKNKISLYPTKNFKLQLIFSLTVKNVTEQKEFKESQVYPEAIEHGMKELENTKFYYSKLNEKKNCSFYLEEPGLLISSSYSWIGASLDGIRKCQCCEPTVVEIKCPFKGKDL